jgi:prephenate dehydrogenase
MDALAPPAARFVGAHPIAGHEDSGLDASRGDLFDGAPCVVTPTPSTDPAALALVEALWTGLGCRLHRLSPAEHDRLFALISHLPHMASYALVRAVFDGVADPGRVRSFTGGGFRDFTRIAASDPAMWRDICLDNRDEILRAIDLLAGELGALRESIAGADGPALNDYFARSRGLRRSL